MATKKIKPKLTLGYVAMTTPCAMELGLHATQGNDLEEVQADMRKMIQRHISGDWGDVSKHDARINNQALATGERILSEYEVRGVTVWVISDAAWGDDPAHRESTTIMLPEDY